MMEFHVGILPNMPCRDCIELGVAAEELGYDGLWLADSHSVFRDCYTLLAALAPRTRSIRLASGVSPTVTRHPAVLANSWATLDELSGGRAILGLGIGESAVHNLGLRAEKLADFEVKLQLIRALIEGRGATYNGVELRSWSRRTVPIFVAASGPRSLQLAGRIADGVLYQVGADPAFHRYALDNIGIGARQSGRELGDLRLYARLACSVAERADTARENVRAYCGIAAGTTYRSVPREYFSEDLWNQLRIFKQHYDYAEHGSSEARHSRYLGDDIIDAVAIAGTPEQVLGRFETLAGLGIDGFVIPFASQQPLQSMRFFAEHLVSRLKE